MCTYQPTRLSHYSDTWHHARRARVRARMHAIIALWRKSNDMQHRPRDGGMVQYACYSKEALMHRRVGAGLVHSDSKLDSRARLSVAVGTRLLL